jgi:prolyl-tRNA synthetase
MMSKDVGITVKKDENFSEWYTQVVTKAGLADYAGIKGFMVLMPHGYSIWERIREFFDGRIKKEGHKNAYFPTLIPESFLRKEAEHFSGFVPEVFWVTHAGDEELSDKLAVRPTSETIAYDSYSRWIKSWRDLPLLLNFWNSVLRAEIKMTKPFIRTSEYLWQEGHTVHATKEDADNEVMLILGIYRDLVEDILAIPVLAGRKTDRDKFVGALYTTTLEALMPDGRALQMATSHNLGQNFSIPFGIKYVGKDEKEHYAWQTSWGASWRLIGATIMVHGDDKGLKLPPKVAPIQIVAIPIYYTEDERKLVHKEVEEVSSSLSQGGFIVHVDDREQYTPGWKFNEWEMKGVPLRIEIGPRDIEEKHVTLVRRDTFGRVQIARERVVEETGKILDEMQRNLFERAKGFLEARTNTTASYDEFKRMIENGGFIKACWCGDTACEAQIKEETGADIRLIPFEREKLFSKCVRCGKEAQEVAYFARAY